MPDRAPQPVDRQLPTDEARDLISLVRDIALSQGMTPLRVDGLNKVKEGLTSIAEIARVA